MPQRKGFPTFFKRGIKQEPHKLIFEKLADHFFDTYLVLLRQVQVLGTIDRSVFNLHNAKFY
jgi:hypothetical protein